MEEEKEKQWQSISKFIMFCAWNDKILRSPVLHGHVSQSEESVSSSWSNTAEFLELIRSYVIARQVLTSIQQTYKILHNGDPVACTVRLLVSTALKYHILLLYIPNTHQVLTFTANLQNRISFILP